MDKTIIIAIIATVVPSIASVAAVFIAYFNSKKSDKIIEKTEVIHKSTNGQLTSLTKALALANERIEGLNSLVASMLIDKKIIADEQKIKDIKKEG